MYIYVYIYTTSLTDLRNKLNWLNTGDSINYTILISDNCIQYLKRLLLITYHIIYETK